MSVREILVSTEIFLTLSSFPTKFKLDLACKKFRSGYNDGSFILDNITIFILNDLSLHIIFTSMVQHRPKKSRGGRRKRREVTHDLKPDMIYLEGRIFDALPGTRFKVRVERAKELDDLYIDADLKTVYKLRRMRLIKGDYVTVEIDPTQNLTHGTIVLVKRENYTPPPRP